MACPRAVLATDHDPGLRFVVGTKGQEAFQQQFSHLCVAARAAPTPTPARPPRPPLTPDTGTRSG